MSRTRDVGEPWWIALVVAGIPLGLYVATLAPTVYGLDSAELTTGAAVLGIVHAPGAPTYMLLAHVFTWLPIGDVGYRVNLLSAVSASIAVLLVYRSLILLVGLRGVAMASSWLLAFSYYFWVSAVAAELYAVHAMFVAAAMWLVTAWRLQGHPGYLYATALVVGIGLGNHLSMVLLTPGFAWLCTVKLDRSSLSPRTLAMAALCLLAGASIYLYLPIRYVSDTPLNYARDYWNIDLASLDGFAWMVSGQMFRGFMFAVPQVLWTDELWRFASRLTSNFFTLGALLGLAGLIHGVRTRPVYHLGLLLLFGGHVAFYLVYAVADKALMFGPVYLVWAIWIAVGAVQACSFVNRYLAPNWSISAAALLGLLALGTCIFNFDLVDLSDDWSARERGERILSSSAGGTTHFGTWADVPILEYLQIVEGQRPDMRTVNLFFVGPAGNDLAKQMLGNGGPVSTTAPHLLGDDLAFEFDDNCRCHKVTLANGAPAR